MTSYPGSAHTRTETGRCPMHHGRSWSAEKRGPQHLCRRDAPARSHGPHCCICRAIFRQAAPLPWHNQLLLEIGFDRITAMMPDDGCWSEAKRPAPLLQAPAYVHVVARDVKTRIEAPDRQSTFRDGTPCCSRECARRPRPTTAREPAPRCIRDAIGDHAVTGRRDIGTANAGVFGSQERRRQIGQPVRIWIGIVVDIGDDLAGCRVQSRDCALLTVRRS